MHIDPRGFRYAVAGLIVLVEQPVRAGDFVRVGDAFGWIQDIGMRATSW